ncbi:hypothetical protein F5X99DRAFT_364943 [Biscogniauxia marginata]|nr:hypothetical protein F5X99DRAFT_364943 [Biscogniauxia marginata]
MMVFLVGGLVCCLLFACFAPALLVFEYDESDSGSSKVGGLVEGRLHLIVGGARAELYTYLHYLPSTYIMYFRFLCNGQAWARWEVGADSAPVANWDAGPELKTWTQKPKRFPPQPTLSDGTWSKQEVS